MILIYSINDLWLLKPVKPHVQIPFELIVLILYNFVFNES